jgi:hypothetical protein
VPAAAIAMSWVDQNRFLGSYVISVGVATLIAVILLFYAKSEFNDATVRLKETATELKRLQSLSPFPNEANFQMMKAQTAEYRVALDKMKEEVKARVLPVTPMQPNEFQARLRETVTKVTEKARANRVKLPEIFFLGFEEFTAALPSNETAPLLGQQLAQVQLIIDILIDARIDGITAFKRRALSEEHAAPASTATSSRDGRTTTVASGPKLIERTEVEATFISSPSAARRVINQIASASQQFYIIRTLHVLNENGKGPPRAQTTQAPSTEMAATGANPKAALIFIVGNEHIQTSAIIELVRFTF